jgi:hypothetical protein
MSAERTEITRTRATLAATTGDTLYIDTPRAGTWLLKSARLIGHDTTSADASNYRTIAVKNGATTLGTLDTSTTDITAGEVREFSLSGDAEFTGAQTGSSTEPASIVVTHAGTGAALDAEVTCVWEPVR